MIVFQAEHRNLCSLNQVNCWKANEYLQTFTNMRHDSFGVTFSPERIEAIFLTKKQEGGILWHM